MPLGGAAPRWTRPPWPRWSLPRLLLLCCCAWVGDGVVSTHRVKLGLVNTFTREHKKWTFVSKFGFGVGRSVYAFRMKKIAPQGALPNHDFQIEAYMDEEWETIQQVENPCERKRTARKTFGVVEGNVSRGWGEWVNGSISQKIRPHMWFFVVSECTNGLENRTATLLMEFIANQEDGSHFSIEQRWAPLANLLVLLGSSGFLLIFWRKASSFAKELGELHPVIWTLGSAAFVLYGAQLLHCVHLGIYSGNGHGSKAMEILSEIFFMISQVVQSTLLLLIALGYTLLRSKIGDLEFVIPLCMIVAMVHILLVVFDKAQTDTAHQFGGHEGFKGWMTMLVRLALYCWFLVAARQTAAKSPPKIQRFMLVFGLASSLYFLAYPILFLVCSVIATYWRRPVMESGLMAAQLLSSVWLGTLFLSKGDYFEASSLSSSPLPGGGSPQRFYKDD